MDNMENDRPETTEITEAVETTETKTKPLPSISEQDFEKFTVVYALLYVMLREIQVLFHTWIILSGKQDDELSTTFAMTMFSYALMGILLILVAFKLWCRSRLDDWEKAYINANLICFFHGIFMFIFAIVLQYRVLSQKAIGKNTVNLQVLTGAIC